MKRDIEPLDRQCRPGLLLTPETDALVPVFADRDPWPGLTNGERRYRAAELVTSLTGKGRRG